MIGVEIGRIIKCVRFDFYKLVCVFEGVFSVCDEED